MTTNRRQAASALAFQRATIAVAVVATIIAWRERSFSRNRARYGSPSVPTR